MKYRTIVADPPWPYEHGVRLWGGRSEWTNPFLPYETMPLKAMGALPVAAIAVPDAHIYLWTTQRFLWDAKAVAEQWGFNVQRVLTWCKKPMGKTSGGAFCNTTEFCLFGRRNPGEVLRASRVALGLSTKDLCAALGAHGGVNHGGAVANWEAGLSLPPPKYLRQLRETLTLGDEWETLAGPPRQHDTTWFQWPRGKHSEKPEHFYDLVEQVSPGPYVELFARRQRLGWDTWGNECFDTAGFREVAKA